MGKSSTASEPHGYDAGNTVDDCHSGDSTTPVQRYLATDCSSVYFKYVRTQGQTRMEGEYGFVFPCCYGTCSVEQVGLELTQICLPSPPRKKKKKTNDLTHVKWHSKMEPQREHFGLKILRSNWPTGPEKWESPVSLDPHWEQMARRNLGSNTRLLETVVFLFLP